MKTIRIQLMYEDEKEIPITDKEIELLNDMIYWLKWGDKDQKKKARQKTLGKIYYSNKELWKAWTGTLNQVDFNPFREEEAS